MGGLIHGGELRQRMRNDEYPYLSEEAAKFYAACMLEGLSYMHRRDYVYRDLKGENVLLIDQGTLFKRIVKGQFQRPRKQSAIDAYQNVSDDAKDIIKKMLVVNTTKRLGCMARADLDIRDHPWFANKDTGIDFGKLYRKELKAPWVPTVTSPFDGQNFSVPKAGDKSKLKPLSDKEQRQFKEFC